MKKLDMKSGIANVFSGDQTTPNETNISQKSSTTIRERSPREEEIKPEKKYSRKVYRKGVYQGDRTTIIMDPGLHNDLSEIAFWDHTSIKELVNEAMKEVVKKYIKIHGELKPIPADKVKSFQAYDRES